MAELTMEKLVNYCKQYGFIFQGSEIYGGFSNTWFMVHQVQDLKLNEVVDYVNERIKFQQKLNKLLKFLLYFFASFKFYIRHAIINIGDIRYAV